MADTTIQTQNFQNPPTYEKPDTSTKTDNTGAALTSALGFAARLASTALGATSTGGLNLITGAANNTFDNLNNDLSQNQTQFAELLRLQNQIQIQNQQFSTLSNVAKTEHETRMAAVRNIRA